MKARVIAIFSWIGQMVDHCSGSMRQHGLDCIICRKRDDVLVEKYIPLRVRYQKINAFPGDTCASLIDLSLEQILSRREARARETVKLAMDRYVFILNHRPSSTTSTLVVIVHEIVDMCHMQLILGHVHKTCRILVLALNGKVDVQLYDILSSWSAAVLDAFGFCNQLMIHDGIVNFSNLSTLFITDKWTNNDSLIFKKDLSHNK
jgi:hypothetical protein